MRMYHYAIPPPNFGSIRFPTWPLTSGFPRGSSWGILGWGYTPRTPPLRRAAGQKPTVSLSFSSYMRCQKYRDLICSLIGPNRELPSPQSLACQMTYLTLLWRSQPMGSGSFPA